MLDGWSVSGSHEALDEKIPAIFLPSTTSSNLVTSGSTESTFLWSAYSTSRQVWHPSAPSP